jgi:hypothetical protein
MLKQIQRIERLHQLIRLKATGPHKECALKLAISERQVYNIIEIMKELGAPIYYNNAIGSYCYDHEVKCAFGFHMKPIIEKTSTAHLRGGVNRFISRYFSPLQFYFSDSAYY